MFLLDLFIRVIGSISDHMFQVGLKSGFISTLIFCIILNSFWSQVKSGLITRSVNIGLPGLFWTPLVFIIGLLDWRNWRFHNSPILLVSNFFIDYLIFVYYLYVQIFTDFLNRGKIVGDEFVLSIYISTD